MFTCVAVVQPAFNLNRIIGGADLEAHEENQRVPEVRQLHTATQLNTRTATTQPDVIVGLPGADGAPANWTVTRVEKWPYRGTVHYHCVLTKQTEGSA